MLVFFSVLKSAGLGLLPNSLNLLRYLRNPCGPVVSPAAFNCSRVTLASLLSPIGPLLTTSLPPFPVTFGRFVTLVNLGESTLTLEVGFGFVTLVFVSILSAFGGLTDEAGGLLGAAGFCAFGSLAACSASFLVFLTEAAASSACFRLRFFLSKSSFCLLILSAACDSVSFLGVLLLVVAFFFSESLPLAAAAANPAAPAPPAATLTFLPLFMTRLVVAGPGLVTVKPDLKLALSINSFAAFFAAFFAALTLLITISDSPNNMRASHGKLLLQSRQNKG